MSTGQEITEREINAMTVVEAYKNFSTYIDPWGVKEDRDIYDEVRYGISGIQFDFYDWANGRMRIKTKSGIVIYRGKSLKEEHLITGYRDWETDRKSTRLNSSHSAKSRMPSSA